MKKYKGKKRNEELEIVTSKIAEKISEKFNSRLEIYDDDLTTVIAMLAEIKFYIDEEKRKRNPAFMPVVPIEKI